MKRTIRGGNPLWMQLWKRVLPGKIAIAFAGLLLAGSVSADTTRSWRYDTSGRAACISGPMSGSLSVPSMLMYPFWMEAGAIGISGPYGLLILCR